MERFIILLNKGLIIHNIYNYQPNKHIIPHDPKMYEVIKHLMPNIICKSCMGVNINWDVICQLDMTKIASNDSNHSRFWHMLNPIFLNSTFYWQKAIFYCDYKLFINKLRDKIRNLAAKVNIVC